MSNIQRITEDFLKIVCAHNLFDVPLHRQKEIGCTLSATFHKARECGWTE